MVGLMISNDAAEPANVRLLADLVALLADGKKASARIADYQAAANELRAESERLQATQKGFAPAEAEHRETLAKASAEHEKAIAKAQQKFDQERLKAENGLAAREKRVADLETKAAEAAAETDKLRADLQRRLEHLKAASAA